MSLDVYLEQTVVCPNCGHEHLEEGAKVLFESNITHNLNQMALKAGVYKEIWRPEEVGITKAKQLIVPLRNAITRLKRNPNRFIKFNSPNGWGTYEHFVPFVREYLEACKRYPDATVKISR